MSTSPEVIRWFTRARRFPQLVGRTPDGARIPGGPYTITQVVGAGAVLLAGTQTMGLWAHYGLLSNALLLLTVTGALVFGLGKIPVGSRNPISVLTGVLRALSAPRTGRVAGRPLRLRRPHVVRHRIVVMPSPLSAAAAAGQPVAPDRAPAPAPQTAASPGRVLVPPADDAPAVPTQQDPARPARLIRRRPARRPGGPTAPEPAGPTRLTRPPRSAPTAAPALSGVQALLAQAATGSSSTSLVDPSGFPVGRPPVPTRSAVED